MTRRIYGITKYEKVNKGVWGMPWLSEAKKDVISCDKLRGSANMNWSVDFRMGQPTMLKAWYTVKGRLTRGTETSKYPEEKKIIMIPRVVASEMGRAQTATVKAVSGL
jgi:hypothetical protein